MKTKLTKSVFAIVFSTFLISCKSTDPLVKQQQVDEIASKLEAKEYTFTAETAQPMSARLIPLTSTYTLKVSPDTITAYLPYFGRAYSITDPTDGGIKFVSTKFDYKMSKKDKGVSTVSISINDSQNRYRLSLLIGELGKTTLYVEQNNKQSISFSGTIY